MDSAVPRDHLRASLLLVLGQAPIHGYDLPSLLGPLGLGGIDRGFLYRTLRHMEADGLVVSEWDPSPNGPARRIYQVTPSGTEWMATAAETLRDADRLMASWLTRYRRLIRASGPRSLPAVPAAS